MKRHTGIYVDLGYREETKIVVIKDDYILDIFTLVPETHFEQVRDTVIMFIRKHKIDPLLVRSRGFPALEESVKYSLRKEV